MILYLLIFIIRVILFYYYTLNAYYDTINTHLLNTVTLCNSNRQILPKTNHLAITLNLLTKSCTHGCDKSSETEFYSSEVKTIILR